MTNEEMREMMEFIVTRQSHNEANIGTLTTNIETLTANVKEVAGDLRTLTNLLTTSIVQAEEDRRIMKAVLLEVVGLAKRVNDLEENSKS